jgi:hypothetical protein
MRSTSLGRWVLGIAALSSLGAVPAAATPFTSSCDRFEVDGSAFGSADGVFDFVDEFDDGTLAPSWTTLLGTAVESGGTVTVRDPGVSIPLGPNVLEISTIENAVHEVGNGDGDFTMVSRWLPTLPVTGAEFHMQLYSIAPIVEAAGITVNNEGPAGYSVSESVTEGFGSGFTTLVFNRVTIAAGDVTGPIVLRMSFDDATDMLTCAFSIDGGGSFQTLPAMHIFNGGVADYDILLGAAVTSVPPPPPPPGSVPMTIFESRDAGTPASRKVRFTAKTTGPFPNLLGFLEGSGAALAIKIDAAHQCFYLPPGSSWVPRSHGNAYLYRDSAGANGPVKVLSVKRGGRGFFQMKGVVLGKLGTLTLAPPNPGVRADVRLDLLTGYDYCAATAGGLVVKNDAKSFKVKDAPAVGTCGITDCSPSGAFLD